MQLAYHARAVAPPRRLELPYGHTRIFVVETVTQSCRDDVIAVMHKGRHVMYLIEITFVVVRVAGIEPVIRYAAAVDGRIVVTCGADIERRPLDITTQAKPLAEHGRRLVILVVGVGDPLRAPRLAMQFRR